MKHNSFFPELTISLVFLILLGFFLDPFHFWMETSATMIMLSFLVALFAAFAVFVWREQARDEREQAHSMFAGRLGFLVGAGILVCAMVYQELTGLIDEWLIYALAAMIIAKLLGLAYSRERR